MRRRRRYPPGSIEGIALRRPRSPDLGQIYGDVHLNEVFMWNGRRWTSVTRVVSMPWKAWAAILGSVHDGSAFSDLPPGAMMGVTAYVARVATRSDRNL